MELTGWKATKKFVKDTINISDIVERDPYTMIKASATYHGRKYTGVGFSKRNPTDAWKPDVGENIAFGMALQDILNQSKSA